MSTQVDSSVLKNRRHNISLDNIVGTGFHAHTYNSTYIPYNDLPDILKILFKLARTQQDSIYQETGKYEISLIRPGPEGGAVKIDHKILSMEFDDFVEYLSGFQVFGDLMQIYNPEMVARQFISGLATESINLGQQTRKELRTSVKGPTVEALRNFYLTLSKESSDFIVEIDSKIGLDKELDVVSYLDTFDFSAPIDQKIGWIRQNVLDTENGFNGFLRRFRNLRYDLQRINRGKHKTSEGNVSYSLLNYFEFLDPELFDVENNPNAIHPFEVSDSIGPLNRLYGKKTLEPQEIFDFSKYRGFFSHERAEVLVQSEIIGFTHKEIVDVLDFMILEQSRQPLEWSKYIHNSNTAQLYWLMHTDWKQKNFEATVYNPTTLQGQFYDHVKENIAPRESKFKLMDRVFDENVFGFEYLNEESDWKEYVSMLRSEFTYQETVFVDGQIKKGATREYTLDELLQTTSGKIVKQTFEDWLNSQGRQGVDSLISYNVVFPGIKPNKTQYPDNSLNRKKDILDWKKLLKDSPNLAHNEDGSRKGLKDLKDDHDNGGNHVYHRLRKWALKLDVHEVYSALEKIVPGYERPSLKCFYQFNNPGKVLRFDSPGERKMAYVLHELKLTGTYEEGENLHYRTKDKSDLAGIDVVVKTDENHAFLFEYHPWSEYFDKTNGRNDSQAVIDHKTGNINSEKLLEDGITSFRYIHIESAEDLYAVLQSQDIQNAFPHLKKFNEQDFRNMWEEAVSETQSYQFIDPFFPK